MIHRFVLVLSVIPLSGCSLERFQIQPCQLNDKLAFRIEAIEGRFSSYQPRPHSVDVAAIDGPNSEYPGLWSTDLKYYSDRDNGYESRPERKLVIYGQTIHGWDVNGPPKSLKPGTKYYVTMSDGGHDGWGYFEAGNVTEVC